MSAQTGVYVFSERSDQPHPGVGSSSKSPDLIGLRMDCNSTIKIAFILDTRPIRYAWLNDGGENESKNKIVFWHRVAKGPGNFFGTDREYCFSSWLTQRDKIFFEVCSLFNVHSFLLFFMFLFSWDITFNFHTAWMAMPQGQRLTFEIGKLLV